MSEDNQEKQDGQKTIVSFVVGLLVGGLLVWVFSGPESTAPTTTDNDGPAVTEEDTDNNSEEDEGEEDTSTPTSTTPPAGDKGGDTPAPPVAELPVGDGSVSVSDQPAASTVTLDAATFPVGEGWIGVRSYANGQLGALLGVVRFSEEQGLVPEEIILQRSTTPGRDYAIVFYTDNGDRDFSLANDVQIDEVFATFTAQ